MAKRNSSRWLNDFDSIDYRKPLGNKQDMRTASYLGHQLLNDTALGRSLQPKCNETMRYADDPVLEKHKTTDCKANYVWKSVNPAEIRNISVDRKLEFMKPFHDCKLKFLARPMRPATSVTHSDYLYQPQLPLPPPTPYHLPSAATRTKIFIDRNKPGYSKYLDPSATTTSLDYCHRSTQDVLNSIAVQDTITFWNWKDIEYGNKNVFPVKDLQLCDKKPSKDCTKRRGELPDKVKAVPNSGLTTEVRDNFIKPTERALVVDEDRIKSDMHFEACDPEIVGAKYDNSALET